MRVTQTHVVATVVLVVVAVLFLLFRGNPSRIDETAKKSEALRLEIQKEKERGARGP